MAEYGMCLGVAFQLMDDALDYAASREDVGKPVGHDLEEGKITLPLLYAMRKDETLAGMVVSIAERGRYADEKERDMVRKIVEDQGGVAHCLATAAEYAERAKLALPGHGETDVLGLLEALADYSASRPY
jgi:octaprenyl-diphosphate synthase